MWAVRNILKGTLKFTDIRVDDSPVRLRSRSYFDLDKIDGGRAAALASSQVQRCFNDGYLQLIHKSQSAGEDAGITLPANSEGHDEQSLENIKKQLEENGSNISSMMQKVLNESQRMRAVDSNDTAEKTEKELEAIKDNMAKIADSVNSNQDQSGLDEITNLRKEMQEMMSKLNDEKERQHQEEITALKSNMKAMMTEILDHKQQQAEIQKNAELENAQIAHQEEMNTVRTKMDSRISQQSKQIEMLTNSIMNLAETTQANNAGVEDIKELIAQNALIAGEQAKAGQLKKRMSKVDIDAALVMADSLGDSVSGSQGPLGNKTTKTQDQNNDVADLLSENDLDFD